MSTENNTIRNVYVAIGVFCLVAALVYLLSSLFNVIGKASNDEGRDEYAQAAVSERIKPVTEVHAGDTSVVVVRSGKEIVEAICLSCHGTGALGAPKIGNKSDWKPRFTAGMKSLMNSATNGKGAMPARGGDASLTDADIEKAIKYMLKESGL